ncbi:hypothetical protein [Staphylococcus epidermidis]|uniref:hypothetical protein n=1 Tax=Staphylococcus epidermidis TaxID=1282 RepID=UPI00119ED33A|nr:hypothetical protein [Staphylococcus epidermidis]
MECNDEVVGLSVRFFVGIEHGVLMVLMEKEGLEVDGEVGSDIGLISEEVGFEVIVIIVGGVGCEVCLRIEVMVVEEG